MNMSEMKRCCDHCGAELHKRSSDVNRANSIGAKLYCDKACAGLARRRKVPLTTEQLKTRKAEYDHQRRENLGDRIKAEKAQYHRRTYSPAKAAIARKARMPYHVAYCRRPEYRAQKAQYDRRLRARKGFGDEFADAFLLLQDIEREIDLRASRYEIYSQKGTLNKAQKRRRSL